MLAKLPTDRMTLLNAADLIENRGHCKEIREERDGSFCVMGAISMAQTGSPWILSIDEPPAQLLATYLGVRSVVGWNNAEERTKDEVVTALRAAALHGL